MLIAFFVTALAISVLMALWAMAEKDYIPALMSLGVMAFPAILLILQLVLE